MAPHARPPRCKKCSGVFGGSSSNDKIRVPDEISNRLPGIASRMMRPGRASASLIKVVSMCRSTSSRHATYKVPPLRQSGNRRFKAVLRSENSIGSTISSRWFLRDGNSDVFNWSRISSIRWGKDATAPLCTALCTTPASPSARSTSTPSSSETVRGYRKAACLKLPIFFCC